MKPIIAALGMLAILGASAQAGPTYTDNPTAEWFKSLSSPYTKNCCDQSDCRRTQADFRAGAWWALSVRTGKWVRIEPDQITSTVSIFDVAVLCEGDPYTLYGEGTKTPTYEARVFCFAPPPIGF
jgi:hypothetical protein